MIINVENGHPDWLKPDDLIFNRTYPGYPPYREPRRAGDSGLTWSHMISFEIADNHPYAEVTAKGFTYWTGGSAAPEDLDPKGRVGYRNGQIGPVNNGDHRWTHRDDDYDIIGYTALARLDLTKPVQLKDRKRSVRVLATDLDPPYCIAGVLTATDTLLRFKPSELENIPETRTRYILVGPTDGYHSEAEAEARLAYYTSAGVVRLDFVDGKATNVELLSC